MRHIGSACAKLRAEGAGSIPFAIKCAMGARHGRRLLRMIAPVYEGQPGASEPLVRPASGA
jgi:hypothetical protein